MVPQTGRLLALLPACVSLLEKGSPASSNVTGSLEVVLDSGERSSPALTTFGEALVSLERLWQASRACALLAPLPPTGSSFNALSLLTKALADPIRIQ